LHFVRGRGKEGCILLFNDLKKKKKQNLKKGGGKREKKKSHP